MPGIMVARFALLLTSLLCPLAGSLGAASIPPKLVVWITVDQLPAEVLKANLARLEPGGFRYFAEQGAYFRRATYGHAVTFTATGHATLFTGRHPSEHGIIANEWADREDGHAVPCVGDPTERLLGEPTSSDQGTSPRLLLCPTVGDLLVEQSGGRSRVFSVSFKDRGAILPGGKRGKAFWFSTSTSRFVSSSYYYERLPAWVDAWNERKPLDAYRSKDWGLLRSVHHYARGAADDRVEERDLFGLGRTFPHPFPAVAGKELAQALACSPAGDEITVQFVEELVRREELGRRQATDLLAISLSSTDMIGHVFGPDSLEAEDNLYRLDRVLARLVSYVHAAWNDREVLWVLSSDHGMGPIPELRSHGQRRAEGGRHDAAVIVARAEAQLKERFGFQEPVIAAFWTPWLYLNEKSLRRQGASVPEVEKALAESLGHLSGIASIWTRTDLAAGRFPSGAFGELLRNAFRADRAGHVWVVPKPGWYLYTESHKYAATHGTPYAYDRTVPILLCGAGVPRKRVDREVHPDALGDAVARLMGVSPPPCEERRRLAELFAR